MTEANDTRELLRDSLSTLLARHYSFDQRRAAYGSPAQESQTAWAAYAELGLFALTLPEEHGGIPGSLADIALVAEMMGGAMTLEPYIATMVGARLIATAGTQVQKLEHLPAIATGDCRAVLAHDETQQMRAERTSAGWQLKGRHSMIAGGDTADLFITSAQTDEGTALFLTPAHAVEREPYRCFDWRGAADITLNDLLLPEDARLQGGADALAHALDEATALACADAVGAMRAANQLTRDHTQTRRQFGKSLDSFQILQHRIVDMLIAQELAGPITQAAILACESGTPQERSRAVSAAKVKAGDSARYIGEQCVQLHGGMGLVQDYPASHLFARLGLFELSNGDRDVHLERYAALDPAISAAPD